MVKSLSHSLWPEVPKTEAGECLLLGQKITRFTNVTLSQLHVLPVLFHNSGVSQQILGTKIYLFIKKGKYFFLSIWDENIHCTSSFCLHLYLYLYWHLYMYLYLVLISPLLLSYVSSLLALLLAPDRLHQLSGATQKHVLRYLCLLFGIWGK